MAGRSPPYRLTISARSQVQLENRIKGDPTGRPYSAGYVLNNRKPKTENGKRVYAVSLGCPKNLVDTEIMLGGLTQRRLGGHRGRLPPPISSWSTPAASSSRPAKRRWTPSWTWPA